MSAHSCPERCVLRSLCPYCMDRDPEPGSSLETGNLYDETGNLADLDWEVGE